MSLSPGWQKNKANYCRAFQDIISERLEILALIQSGVNCFAVDFEFRFCSLGNAFSLLRE